MIILKLLLNTQIICKMFIRNIEEYNPEMNCKVFIVFNDTIADMINNKKLNPVVTELFIRERKLKVSIVYIYFKVPKDVRLNSTHYCIMKILNTRELQQIALNQSSDFNSKDFMKIYKNVLQNYILFWLMIQL